MPKDYLPINETSPNNPHKEYSNSKVTQAKEVDTKPSTANSESFKGFLLASYKSIANVARAHKITRLMFITYLLILVVFPPIFIMFAFLAFPSQTAGFFNFSLRPELSLSRNSNPQVLGAHTANQQGNVLASYVSGVLEPQAVAAVKTLRVVSPQTVSDVILPSDQGGTQTSGIPGPQGPAGQPGSEGATGLTGSQGLAGTNGAKGDTGSTGTTGATGSVGALTTGSGLTGTLTSGNLTLNLDTNTLSIAGGKTLTVNQTITFGGTDGTSFTLPSSTDTLVGLSSTDTLTNKTLSAGSNTISGLTNSNLSGSAAITNANLANSALTVTAGTGLSGGGAVSLGGSVSLTNAGVTALSGTTNQVNVSASTGDITLTLPQNVHSAASPTFNGLTLSALTNCGSLATNSSGEIVCDGATGDTATFTDTTPATIADNDTTELFNDTTKPSITPDISTQTILVSVHMKFTAGGGADTYSAIRIVRNNGSAASCSTSSQVGDTFGAFMTNDGVAANATATFLDSPSTTGEVFYTVCSSTDSFLGSTPVSNRIDVTLVELGQ